FNQYKKQGGADRAFWLALWDAQTHYVDRKHGEQRRLTLEHPCVSIASGCQPGLFGRVFARDNRASGLLARFLVAFPPANEPKYNEDVLPAELGARFGAIFERLSKLEIERYPDSGRVRPRRLRLSPGARELFIVFYEQHSRQGIRLDDDGSASFSKLLGIVG